MPLPESSRYVWARLAIPLLAALGCHRDHTATTPDTTAPAPISTLASSQPTTASLTLTWMAPGDDGESGTATSYEVRLAKAPLDAVTVTSAAQAPNVPRPLAAGAMQSLQVLNLESGTNYYFALRTADEIPNWSDWSFLGPIATRPDTIAPAPVTDLHVVSVGDQSVILAWTAPGDDDRSGRAAEYDLRVSPTPIDSSNFRSATRIRDIPNPADPGAPQQATAPGLVPRHRFYAALTTQDEAGNFSSLSNSATFITDRSPRDWTVSQDGSGDTSSLQAAVDSAYSGESIYLRPGTYLQTVKIVGKALRLRGEGVNPNETTLDGQFAGGAVIFAADVPEPGLTIENLTVTRGRGFVPSPVTGSHFGGGIYLRDSSGTLISVRLIQNGNDFANLGDTGGGIYARRTGSSTPLSIDMNKCEVNNNMATSNGGGIAIEGPFNVMIVDSIMYSNRTKNGDGGAAWIAGSPIGTELLLLRCSFTANDAGDHGGALYLIDPGAATAFVSNCLFVRNAAFHKSNLPHGNDAGAALHVKAGALALVNNTFYLNVSTLPTGQAGCCIAVLNASHASIFRNIVAESVNSFAFSCISSSVAFSGPNLMWRNSAGNGIGECATALDSSCPILLNPQFCNPDADWLALRPTSPALLPDGAFIGAMGVANCGDGRTENRLSSDLRNGGPWCPSERLPDQ